VGHSAFGPTDNRPACSLILRKISKTGADNYYQILRLNPPNLLGKLAAPLDSLAVFLRGREGEKGERGWREGFGPPKKFSMGPPMAERADLSA